MTTMPDPTSSTEPPTSLEEAARIAQVPVDLHLHFDMGAESQSGSVEVIAHRYAKKYFGDVPYRMNIKTHAQVNDGNIVGYKVTVEARKYIDYGDW